MAVTTYKDSASGATITGVTSSSGKSKSGAYTNAGATPQQYKNVYNKYGILSNSNSGGGNRYYGGGGGGESYSSGNDYYASLLASFESQAKQARDAAIAAIMKNLEATKGTYNNQIEEVKDKYGRLIDENEVKKYQARRVIRENQANRGQLDSGLGRQEQLNMNIGYDNQTSNLNSSRTRAVNDIMNLITQAEAEAENNKANIMNNYANQLLQFRLANM